MEEINITKEEALKKLEELYQRRLVCETSELAALTDAINFYKHIIESYEEE